MSNAPPIESEKKIGKRRRSLRAGLISLGVLAGIGCVYSFMHPPETQFESAVSLVKQGKAAAALPILEQLSRQHPDNPSVFPWLAQCYLRTDRIAEGRTALDTALRLKLKGTSLAPVVLAYANYYESRNDFAEAERLYESATKVCNESELIEGRARLYLGWSEDDMAQGQLSEAVRHLELANVNSDQLPEPLKSVVPHRLSAAYRQLAGLAEMQEHNEAKARNLLEKSLQVSDEPAARMALAAMYAKQGEKDKAIENYQKVAEADPNNLEARHKLIELLLERKDFEHAQLALVELTDKEKSEENFELLATLNLKLGNFAGAVRAYEDACDLHPRLELLKQLETTLLRWHDSLVKSKMIDQAASVKGHAERIAEQISELTKDKDKDKQLASALKPDDPRNPPVSLSSSRIWLARGSLTPEGEIRIQNVSGQPVPELSLSAVFFDNTTKSVVGSVVLPVASGQSAAFAPDASRSLYFSCPNIVKADHQLAVIIFWKGKFLKEFPVVKQR